MGAEQSYHELQQRVKLLEEEILKHQRMEESLREREEKFRVISEQSSLAILIIQDDVVVYANQAASTMIGCSIEEILQWGENEFIKYVHPDHRPFILEQAEKKQKGSEEVVTEHSYRLANQAGKIIWVKNYSKTILYNGKYADFVTLMDITKQKQAEQMLQESEERFRSLSEASFEGIFIHENGQVIDINKTLETMLGYDYTDCVGKNLLDFVTPEFVNIVKKTYLSGYELPYEAECFKKDGRVLPIEVHAKNAMYNGHDVRVVAIRDITERKQAEKALMESEERLRAIFEASADPIVLYDINGHPQYLNPAFTHVFGWTLDELNGEQIPFVPESEKERTLTGIKKLYDDYYGNKEPIIDETRRLTKDGISLDILLSASLIEGPEKDPAGMVVNLKNITERKKLEAQFQTVQRMEAIGTLAGGIAHDFNNLLMAIGGNVSLMLMKKDPTHSDYARLTNIEQYVKNGAALTKQLLGFARGGKYDVKVTDINALVKRASEMFGRTRKEITVHEKYQEDVRPVEVDQGQLDQVLLNIFVNAWQAMPGGGKLYLETAEVVLNVKDVKPFNIQPGNYVKISVTDTGIGMDKATLHKIFEPFFTTKDMGRGTGLGLASTYGIIKNHGGFINVYSESGEGTTFNIYLPASEKGIPEEKESDEMMQNDSGTVLLVDDEEMILDVGMDILAELGYKVLIARSGKEALEIYSIKRETIDIVILDMIMPSMSGGETYDRLKNINPHICVLLSSGYSINGEATEILNRGCRGFIQKPFNIKELSLKIKEVLAKDCLRVT